MPFKDLALSIFKISFFSQLVEGYFFEALYIKIVVFVSCVCSWSKGFVSFRRVASQHFVYSFGEEFLFLFRWPRLSKVKHFLRGVCRGEGII